MNLTTTLSTFIVRVTTIYIFKGKQKMVEWTSVFTNGITMLVSTPKVITNRQQVSYPSFPIQPYFSKNFLYIGGQVTN